MSALNRIETALETYSPGLGALEGDQWETALHTATESVLTDFLALWLDFYGGRGRREAESKAAEHLTYVVERALKGAGYDLPK